MEILVIYSKVLSNFDIVKNSKLKRQLQLLDHKGLKGGLGAVLNYPKENPSKVVIAFVNNKPIGWISDTNGIQNIYVQVAYRKTGIASKLKDIIYNRK